MNKKVANIIRTFIVWNTIDGRKGRDRSRKTFYRTNDQVGGGDIPMARHWDRKIDKERRTEKNLDDKAFIKRETSGSRRVLCLRACTYVPSFSEAKSRQRANIFLR